MDQPDIPVRQTSQLPKSPSNALVKEESFPIKDQAIPRDQEQDVDPVDVGCITMDLDGEGMFNLMEDQLDTPGSNLQSDMETNRRVLRTLSRYVPQRLLRRAVTHAQDVSQFLTADDASPVIEWEGFEQAFDAAVLFADISGFR